MSIAPLLNEVEGDKAAPGPAARLFLSPSSPLGRNSQLITPEMPPRMHDVTIERRTHLLIPLFFLLRPPSRLLSGRYPALPTQGEQQRAAAGEPAQFRKRRHPPRIPRQLESPGHVYQGCVCYTRRVILVEVATMPAEASISAAVAPAVAVANALVRG